MPSGKIRTLAVERTSVCVTIDGPCRPTLPKSQKSGIYSSARQTQRAYCCRLPCNQGIDANSGQRELVSLFGMRKLANQLRRPITAYQSPASRTCVICIVIYVCQLCGSLEIGANISDERFRSPCRAQFRAGVHGMAHPEVLQFPPVVPHHSAIGQATIHSQASDGQEMARPVIMIITSAKMPFMGSGMSDFTDGPFGFLIACRSLCQPDHWT
jgi:hypothetical protein